jgi:hypothetical protein
MLHSGSSTFRPLLVDRFVNRTITLVCVLIVYDGWATLRYGDVVGIIVGPILAMFVTHVFSASLAQHVALERRMTRPEWVKIVRSESLFLLLAIPPLALLGLFALAGVSLEGAIHAIIWIEALSIGFWAGVAARRAGLQGSSLAIAVLAGLIVSGIVLALQVLLQPGKAVEGGVATGKMSVVTLTR